MMEKIPTIEYRIINSQKAIVDFKYPDYICPCVDIIPLERNCGYREYRYVSIFEMKRVMEEITEAWAGNAHIVFIV